MFILQGCRNSKKKVQLYFESVRSRGAPSTRGAQCGKKKGYSAASM